MISIHALLAESDCQTAWPGCLPGYFYPRSPCGERLDTQFCYIAEMDISIHALLAESDIASARSGPALVPFLSTLSLRRATREVYPQRRRPGHFYPRSPCGERPYLSVLVDLYGLNFYPRSPCGERPVTLFDREFMTIISIHALLAESDLALTGTPRAALYFYPRSPCGERHDGLIASANFCNFYPRSPCGERLVILCAVGDLVEFLSTLSLRRATSFTLFF